jgi:excinuclease ABC subunit A
VVVIEHNLDVIKTADYIIDLGPEGGDEGGTIVAQGTPEEVANIKGSYTGLFLRKVLSLSKKRTHSPVKRRTAGKRRSAKKKQVA